MNRYLLWTGLKMLPAQSRRHPNMSVHDPAPEEEALTFPFVSVE